MQQKEKNDNSGTSIFSYILAGAALGIGTFLGYKVGFFYDIAFTIAKLVL